jgi:hypothetical protein
MGLVLTQGAMKGCTFIELKQEKILFASLMSSLSVNQCRALTLIGVRSDDDLSYSAIRKKKNFEITGTIEAEST